MTFTANLMANATPAATPAAATPSSFEDAAESAVPEAEATLAVEDEYEEGDSPWGKDPEMSDEGEEPEVEEPEGEEPEDAPPAKAKENPVKAPAKVPAKVALKDEQEYQVGDETVTGKELKSRMLMQADYTKKTQALAVEKREASVKVEAAEDEATYLKTWAKSLNSPADMQLELTRHFPEAFNQLKMMIVDEAIKMADMPDDEYRNMYAEKTTRELLATAKARDAERFKELDRKKSVRSMSLQFKEWVPQAMLAAGLDLSNEEHTNTLLARIVAGRQGEKWDSATFHQEAVKLAKLLGVSPPGAKGATAAPAAKPKLPPAKVSGGTPPLAKRDPETGRFQPPKKKVLSISDMRRKVGLF